MDIRDRIVELRRVEAADLIPHPRNWRRHPPEQVFALRGVLAQIGFADAAIGVERDAGVMLIDGHVRREEVDPNFEMPVLIVDLDDDEADLLLATLDPIGAMASPDAAVLQALLVDLEGQNEGVNKLLEDLSSDAAGRLAKDVPPDDFGVVDPDGFDLEHTCPRCGYGWSD